MPNEIFLDHFRSWCLSDQGARDESRLFDVCLAAGMSASEPSVSEWAARKAYRLQGGTV